MNDYENLFKKFLDSSIPTKYMVDDIKPFCINLYKRFIDNGIKSEEMETCHLLLLVLDRIYQEGFVTPLRDSEYDALLELYLDNGGVMIRGDLSSKDTAVHVFPNLKGTIKKCHYVTNEDKANNPSAIKNHKTLEDWLYSCAEQLHLTDNTPIDLGFFIKFDGLSIVFEIDKNFKVKSAITRGDKELGEGQNKFNVFKPYNFSKYFKPEFKMIGDHIGLKCEIIMTTSDFEEYNSKFGNNELVDPRTAVSSIVNSDNPTYEQLKYIRLMPLVLYMDGKEYPLPNYNESYNPIVLNDIPVIYALKVYNIYKNKNDLLNLIKVYIDRYTKLHNSNFKYPNDGVVVRIMNEEYRKKLGRNEEDCVNNWERAYKFPPATAKSKIIDITQEIGLLGKVSFTAVVEPVVLKNKTIRNISLGSAERFKILNLAKGDEVLVQYDIIPYLIVDGSCKRSGNEPIKMIDKCPYCGEDLVLNPELSCVNSECPSRVVGKIYNYCQKMNLDNIGESKLVTLYNKGILRKISDLYSLKDKEAEILDIDGFGKKGFNNMIKTIKDNNKTTPDNFLGALGIPSIGRRTFKKILEKIPFDELVFNLKENESKLHHIEGIKEKTISKIVDGINTNLEEIKTLLNHIKIKSIKSKETVCFTGIRNKAFEKHLEKLGIEVTDNFNKEVSLLITAGKPSSKVEKALKWGTKIMNISDAYKLFNYVEE